MRDPYPVKPVAPGAPIRAAAPFVISPAGCVQIKSIWDAVISKVSRRRLKIPTSG
jgi:hypothetical protein